MEGLTLLNIVTFAWLAFWAARAIKAIARGQRHSVLFVIVVYFIFFGTPLFLDQVAGTPSYHDYPGFLLAVSDMTTSVVYCLFASSVVIILWYLGQGNASEVGRRRFEEDIGNLIELTRRIRPILIAIVLLPLPILFFAPDPSIYLNYGIATQLVPGSANSVYYELVAGGALLSLLAAIAVLISLPRFTVYGFATLAPVFLFDIWIYGKRSAVVESLLLIGYVAWLRGILRGRRLIVLGLIAVIGIGVFSTVYQQNVRGYLERSQTSQRHYDETRIDYGRDEESRLALYALLHPDALQILEYPGESFLFNLTQYVPRSFWPGKPYPYAVYITSASFQAPPTSWGWGVTTSILDESIANFGWLGVLLGPLLLCIFCRLGDGCRNGVARPLTVLIACLLLVVQVQPYAPLLYLWIVVVARDWWRRRTYPQDFSQGRTISV